MCTSQKYYLATGSIFKAKLRLIQNPAPPVANQNENISCNKVHHTSTGHVNAAQNQQAFAINLFEQAKLAVFVYLRLNHKLNYL